MYKHQFIQMEEEEEEALPQKQRDLCMPKHYKYTSRVQPLMEHSPPPPVQVAQDRLTIHIPSETTMMSDTEQTGHPTNIHHATPGGGGGLVRQSSGIKSTNNCLCAPTTHVGSFRCRLHRAPGLQRTKSLDPTSPRESATKDANANSVDS